MPTGAAVTYVSGGHTDHDHLGLPRADAGYRAPHAERERKPSGLDWGALAPTCKACRQKTGTVNTSTGLCSTCAPPAKKAEPVQPPKKPRRVAAPHRPRATPPPPPVTAVVTPAAVVAPDSRLELDRDLDRAVHLLTISHEHPSPAVQSMRGRVLGVLDALEAFLDATKDRYEPAAQTSPQPVDPRPQAAGSRRAPRERRETRATRRDKITLDAAAVAAGYAAGKSLIDLAEEFGVSHPVIARHLDEQGVPRRRPRIAYTDDLLAQVRHLYVDEHLTQQQVADRLGLTLKVIQTAMLRGNIEARESASALSMRGIGHVFKIPRDEHQTIVARYRAGEPAPVIARDFNVSPTSIYPILDAHGITERHGHRSTPGHDGAAGLKARIRDLGIPVADIKAWAVRQGLLEMSGPGLPPARVVDAYVEAHPSLDAQEATA